MLKCIDVRTQLLGNELCKQQFNASKVQQLTSLSQLENILLPVNDFKLTFNCPQSDISTMKPPLLVNCFPCLFFIFIVSLEYWRTPDTYLSTTTTWLVVVRCICTRLSYQICMCLSYRSRTKPRFSSISIIMNYSPLDKYPISGTSTNTTSTHL